MTWTGGSANSDIQVCSDQFPDPSTLLITAPSLMQAWALAWQSQSAHSGMHGNLLMVGSPKGGTFSGQRQLDSNSLPSAYAH